MENLIPAARGLQSIWLQWNFWVLKDRMVSCEAVNGGTIQWAIKCISINFVMFGNLFVISLLSDSSHCVYVFVSIIL